jgi:uncharacterized protein YecT (DUF1311 family)
MKYAVILTLAMSLKRADDELNRVYGALLSKESDADAVAKIRRAEEAWIRYRDAYIEAMWPAKDKQAEYGTVYPMQVNLVRANLTRRQVDALKELAEEHSPR